MSSAYLFAFTTSDFTQEEVSDFFDKLEGIEDWFYSIPGTIFLVGNIPAKTLSKLFMRRFGEHRHFVTFISKKARAGWLPKNQWDRMPKDETN